MTEICSVEYCNTPMSAKSARGMCPRHYGSWLRTGSAVKVCGGCGGPVRQGNIKFCSEVAVALSARGGWCASHYHQAKTSRRDPVPFKFRWNDLVLAHLRCNMAKSDRVQQSQKEVTVR